MVHLGKIPVDEVEDAIVNHQSISQALNDLGHHEQDKRSPSDENVLQNVRDNWPPGASNRWFSLVSC